MHRGKALVVELTVGPKLGQAHAITAAKMGG